MSRSGCGLKRVVRCTGTGHGGRVAFGLLIRRVRTSVSVYSRKASATPPRVVAFGLLSFGRIVSAGKKHSNQNWHGPGESDCLIKTKHCDGRKTVLTQCDFCPVV